MVHLLLPFRFRRYRLLPVALFYALGCDRNGGCLLMSYFSIVSWTTAAISHERTVSTSSLDTVLGRFRYTF